MLTVYLGQELVLHRKWNTTGQQAKVDSAEWISGRRIVFVCSAIILILSLRRFLSRLLMPAIEASRYDRGSRNLVKQGDHTITIQGDGSYTRGLGLNTSTLPTVARTNGNKLTDLEESEHCQNVHGNSKG